MTVGRTSVSTMMRAACAAVVCMSLPLLGCSKPVPLRVSDRDNYPIRKPCNKNADTYLPAAVILLKNLDTQDLKGTVIEKHSTDEYGNEPVPPSLGFIHSTDQHTYADFDAGNLLRDNNPPHVLLIRLDLTGAPGYSFDPTNPVVTDDPSNGRMFCVKKGGVVLGPENKTATFYVFAMPPENGKPLTGLYKFNAVDLNGRKVVRPIDPEVQNEG